MDSSIYSFYNNVKERPLRIWLMFIFIGWSYGGLGNKKLQFLYYITLGGIGIWTIYRLFTLNGVIKKHNQEIARQIGISRVELSHIDKNQKI